MPATPGCRGRRRTAGHAGPGRGGRCDFGHHHTRLIISIALLVVTLVATPLFIVSIWVHTAITDTDRYVHAVGPLADDPAVQE